jgi:potassium/hydrogen antiporter
MSSVALFLIAIASIFLIGAVGEVIFQRTNVPDVIWLILAGILLGPVIGLVEKPQLNAIAPYFAALTLVVVLFGGGSTLRLTDLSRAASRSTFLALVNFIVSAMAMAVLSMLAAWVGWLPSEWSWMHGWMLGAILGGTSSIIIMPAMAQARVAPRVANLLNLESALTDAFCVVGTVALIDVMLKGGGGAAGPAMALLKSFGIGLAVGLVAGLVWMLFLRVLHSSEHAYPVTLAALLFLYVLIDHMGGSAALGILAVAVILGNARSLGPRIGLKDEVELDTGVTGTHRQLVFMIKSFFFVFIGAMLDGPISLLLIGLVFGLVLFAVRIPGTRLSLLGSDLNSPQKNLVTVAMPRGMAAGVLATLPVSAGVPGTETLPVIVFAAVFTTILVFAIGFPWAKKRIPAEAAAPVLEAAATAQDQGAVVELPAEAAPLTPRMVDDETAPPA